MPGHAPRDPRSASVHHDVPRLYVMMCPVSVHHDVPRSASVHHDVPSLLRMHMQRSLQLASVHHVHDVLLRKLCVTTKTRQLA